MQSSIASRVDALRLAAATAVGGAVDVGCVVVVAATVMLVDVDETVVWRGSEAVVAVSLPPQPTAVRVTVRKIMPVRIIAMAGL
jgi:hypothetical protein